jgi:hypothetical protein
MPSYGVTSIGTVTAASGVNPVITVGAGGVPKGSLIVVIVTEKSTSGTNGTLADSASNSYSTATSGSLANTAADGRGIVFYIGNCAALVNTNTITYTKNLSTAVAAMSAFYVTGIQAVANPLDSSATATATGTTGTITVTSGTPSGGAEFFVGALCDSGSSTAGAAATFANPGGWTTPPVEANTSTSASGNARVDGGNRVGAASGTLVYNPTLSSTAQQWFLAILAFKPALLWGQTLEQDTQPPLTHPTPIKKRAAAFLAGDTGTAAIEPGFTPQGFQHLQPFQPPHQMVAQRGGAAKHNTGFQWPLGQPPFGWPVQDPQPPARPPKLRSSGLEFRNEFASFQSLPFGFEQTQAQPLKRTLRPSLIGDDGTEAKFVPPVVVAPTTFTFDVQPAARWFAWPKGALKHSSGFLGSTFFPPPGWEIQSPQPPHPTPEKRAGGTMRGDDGNQYPLINFFPPGWEIQPPQPGHPRPERSGAVARGDDGTEAPFVPPIVVTAVNWGFDFQQSVSRKYYRFVDQLQTFRPFPWLNFGFDLTSSQDQRFRRERSAAIFRGDDGNEAPFVNWKNAGWEVQYFHAPHRFWKNLDRGDDGNEAPFVNWKNAGWEIQYSDIPHRFRKNPEPGDGGIEASFVNWRNAGWEIQYGDVRHRFFKNPDRGDDGIEAQFVAPPAFVPTWFEPNPPFAKPLVSVRGALKHSTGFQWPAGQPPFSWEVQYGHVFHRIFKSPDIGDSGIEAKFVFVPPAPLTPLGYPLPEIVAKRPVRANAVGFRNEFASPLNIPSFGWPIPYSDIRHRFIKYPEIGSGGIEGPLPAPPPLVFVGYPFQDTTLKRRFRQDFKGDDGIEAKFIFVPLPPLISWPFLNEAFFRTKPKILSALKHQTGFATPSFVPLPVIALDQLFQPVLRYNRLSATEGVSQFRAFNMLPVGFDLQEQILRRLPTQRLQATKHTTGFAFPITMLAPFNNQIWEQLYYLHRQRPLGALRTVSEFAYQLIPPPPFNWETQPPQPPHHFFKNLDAGDVGIEFPIVPPMVFQNGWWVQDVQPGHPRRERAGAIMLGDLGTESPFIIPVLFNFKTYDVQPNYQWRRISSLKQRSEFSYLLGPFLPFNWQTQYGDITHRFRKSPDTGDAGIEQAKPAPPTPFGWPIPYTDVRHRFLKSPEFGLPGIDRPIPPPPKPGWEISPPQPLFNRMGRRGAFLYGDNGIEFPFIPVIPPPQPVVPFRRVPTGKVFIIDSLPGYYFGPNPNLNESCSLVFVVGPGLPILGSRVLFTFIKPDGTIVNGDPNFAFIGDANVFQWYIPNFPQAQYLVYTFGIGELDQHGVWQVSAIAGGFFSNTFTFPVN